jgi:hypothetical protein
MENLACISCGLLFSDCCNHPSCRVRSQKRREKIEAFFLPAKDSELFPGTINEVIQPDTQLSAVPLRPL